MMVEGHKMNLVYYDPYPNKRLEQYIAEYAELLKKHGEPPVTCKRLDSVEEVLKESDVSGQGGGRHVDVQGGGRHVDVQGGRKRVVVCMSMPMGLACGLGLESLGGHVHA